MNVGCADSVYINCGDYNVLIDAGNESLQNKSAAYLRENGVKKLDLVIATHPDKDHIGGMQEVAGTFPVERFWIPQVKEKLVPDSGFYTGMLWNLENRKRKLPIRGRENTCGSAIWCLPCCRRPKSTAIQIIVPLW